ncbi:class I SAM-dependent methyltransferase [Streptomyces sp. TS71-3]|uniref:class I SAM-dependent methyltransferase n=1 Tax=Streptomyces sp. TS71-3 TaxID=2733862 RepID=UPI001B00E329|nr:class I SAM-dependent methyltransferase [Streptomyces sp. TS71-3]GHJ37122.1 hypothetical protein Sm713_27310 [Streptomyces sp. TS71-3]
MSSHASPLGGTESPSAYDSIGGHYQDVKSLPAAEAEDASVLDACGDVTGMRVIDFACGTGHYTRELRRRGAGRCLGVDLSAAMVEMARRQEHEEPLGIDYQVGDATDLPALGRFDLATGAWLLNYAADLVTLTAMLSSVARNLAPGRRFVGATQNPDFDFGGPSSPRYGWSFVPVGETPFGTQVQATAHTSPAIHFPAQFARAEMYDRAARDAGFTEFSWLPLTVPEDAVRRRGREFWKEYRANPFLAVFSTRLAPRTARGAGFAGREPARGAGGREPARGAGGASGTRRR